MTKALILTSRDIYRDHGEKMLMSAKQKALGSHNIEVFYAVCRWSALKEEELSSEILLDFRTQEILTASSNVFKRSSNIIRKLLDIIQRRKIDILVVSGVWFVLRPSFFSKIKKLTGVSISYDMQGCLEEIKEYKMAKKGENGAVDFFLQA